MRPSKVELSISTWFSPQLFEGGIGIYKSHPASDVSKALLATELPHTHSTKIYCLLCVVCDTSTYPIVAKNGVSIRSVILICLLSKYLIYTLSSIISIIRCFVLPTKSPVFVIIIRRTASVSCKRAALNTIFIPPGFKRTYGAHVLLSPFGIPQPSMQLEPSPAFPRVCASSLNHNRFAYCSFDG